MIDNPLGACLGFPVLLSSPVLIFSKKPRIGVFDMLRSI
jgi:hypothetical protein